MKRKAFSDHFMTISQHILRPLLHFLLWIKTSVIRQKSELQNGYLKKTKHATFSRKQTFLTPWYAHVRMHIREAIKVRFSVGMLCFVVFFGIFFWNIRFEIRLFALLPTKIDNCNSSRWSYAYMKKSKIYSGNTA